jgi:hypothetical protein
MKFLGYSYQYYDFDCKTWFDSDLKWTTLDKAIYHMKRSFHYYKRISAITMNTLDISECALIYYISPVIAKELNLKHN